MLVDYAFHLCLVVLLDVFAAEANLINAKLNNMECNDIGYVSYWEFGILC